MTQYKSALEAYNVLRETYREARKPIATAFKAEIAAAKSVRDAALVLAITPEAKLAVQNAFKAAVAAATAKRDAAVTALGLEPVRPAKPNLGVKPTPPTKPTKAPKSNS
jgi:hypothetical protein